jgi:hypothetical protein
MNGEASPNRPPELAQIAQREAARADTAELQTVDSQSWLAFQSTMGEHQSATRPEIGQNDSSQRRCEGATRSQNSMPRPRKRPVYFDSRAIRDDACCDPPLTVTGLNQLAST